MINYIWTVTAMYTLPMVEGYTDVVVIADWTLTGISGEYSSSKSDSTQFSLPQGENFTPYEDLTEVQVVGWIKETIGLAQNVEAAQRLIALAQEFQQEKDDEIAIMLLM